MDKTLANVSIVFKSDARPILEFSGVCVDVLDGILYLEKADSEDYTAVMLDSVDFYDVEYV